MNGPDSSATAGRNYSIRVFSLCFERVTSEKRLYEETRFAEELQLGFDILHNREFYFGSFFMAFCVNILHHFCSLYFFLNSDVNKFFLSVLFCPCGTKCSIKLTTVE